MSSVTPSTPSEQLSHADIEQLAQRIKAHSKPFRQLITEVGNTIVGQEQLIHRMLVGLLANGHLLIEGVPGLAKTTAVACLAKAISTGFQRLQFTPDLLPADLIGTLIYRPQDQQFVVQKGPIFSNLILADEINRAPAKVQSALLEAMQERQVTIGDETFKLDEPFLVMATQNPIEQEGTYPLPEAQMDRFMLKVVVGYPNRDQELLILERMSKTRQTIETHAVTIARRDPRCPCARRRDLRRPQGAGIYRRPGAGHAEAEVVWPGTGRADPIWRVAAGDDLPDACRQSERLPARPRPRAAAGREGDGARRAAASRDPHLRSRGGGENFG